MNSSKILNQTTQNRHDVLPSVVLCAAPCRYVLKGFSQEGRDLTDDETKAFLKAADKDGDGKIGIDGASTSPTHC